MSVILKRHVGQIAEFPRAATASDMSSDHLWYTRRYGRHATVQARGRCRCDIRSDVRLAG